MAAEAKEFWTAKEWRRLKKTGVIIRKQKAKKQKPTTPVSSGEEILSMEKTEFVKNPPLHFVYMTNGGAKVIFRLVKNNEDNFVYSVEYVLNGISQFDYLYYWRKESPVQEALNDKMNIKPDMRWADTFTATRSESYGSTNSHIQEMLENLGVDIEESF